MKDQYVFLDVEWYAAGKECRPIELGAVFYPKCRPDFFSYIKPTDLNEVDRRISKLLHLNVGKEKLLFAPELTVVMQKLSELIPKAAVMVFQNRAGWDVFQKSIKDAGLPIPTDRLILLDQLIPMIEERYGYGFRLVSLFFECRIPYDPERLHRSDYDAQKLQELFLAKKGKYEELTEEIPELGLNEKTQRIHCRTCAAYGRIRAERKASLSAEDLFKGYRFCKICKPETHVPKMRYVSENAIKQYSKAKKKKKKQDPTGAQQFSKENIMRLCAERNLKYCIFPELLLIDSGIAKWKIYHDGEKVTGIVHGNHKNEERNFGYHKQDVDIKRLSSALEYIVRHDNFRMLEVIQKQERKDKSGQREKKRAVPGRRGKTVKGKREKRTYYLEKDEYEDYYAESEAIRKVK